jgi:hypothetical protein
VNIYDELEALSKAHGPAALGAAFRALQGAVRRERRDDKAGVLARTFRAAMVIWDAQKAEGVSKAERVAGLEKTLRVAWPQTREWKYLCGECRDTGLVIRECDGDPQCGCSKKHQPHLPHEYGTACWCSLGAKFRKPKPEPEDYAQAGRTQKMSRVGR